MRECQPTPSSHGLLYPLSLWKFTEVIAKSLLLTIGKCSVLVTIKVGLVMKLLQLLSKLVRHLDLWDLLHL